MTAQSVHVLTSIEAVRTVYFQPAGIGTHLTGTYLWASGDSDSVSPLKAGCAQPTPKTSLDLTTSQLNNYLVAPKVQETSLSGTIIHDSAI
jgi:hypothetical protein